MPQKLKLFLVIAIVLFVLAYVSGLISPAQGSSAGIDIIPQKESFSELYFNNHSNLPTTIVQNQEYSFSFTIQNRNLKSVNYLYQVVLTLDGIQTMIDSKTVSLAPDESKEIAEKYKINTTANNASITVSLPNQNLHIDYLINAD